jgi:hypothetical protein
MDEGTVALKRAETCDSLEGRADRPRWFQASDLDKRE